MVLRLELEHSTKQSLSCTSATASQATRLSPFVKMQILSLSRLSRTGRFELLMMQLLWVQGLTLSSRAMVPMGSLKPSHLSRRILNGLQHLGPQARKSTSACPLTMRLHSFLPHHAQPQTRPSQSLMETHVPRASAVHCRTSVASLCCLWLRLR